jgi:hypothetical protein
VAILTTPESRVPATSIGERTMTIQERAAIALDRARAAGTPEPAADTAHLRRLRAAMTRDVAAMLGILPEHVVVTDDPLRAATAVSPGS